MSWEVRTVRSKTSFFNSGIAKNMLRRYWPVWAGYFAFILLVFSMTVVNLRGYDYTNYSYRILASGRGLAIYGSFFIAVLAAMVVFSFLYSTRSCGMMTSLPVKRETVFMTAYLTGLVPLLLADVLTALLVGPFAVSFFGVGPGYLLQWLCLVVMGNIVFYGIAVFCAMLTGSIIVMPVVYGMLNLAAALMQLCALNLMAAFVYGFVGKLGGAGLAWLSPVVKLGDCLQFTWPAVRDGTCTLHGWGVLLLYCAVGLLLSAAALWLYRRRDMERATDTVAIPVLKPVFRYCMAVGTGLVFAIVLYLWFFEYSGVKKLAAALVIGLLLVVGAAIGWFAAEMLIQKTVRVFKGRWKGCITVCLVLAALTMALELDLFGIERAVPEAENVKSVILVNTTFAEPENIQRVIQLHRQMIGSKQRNEDTDDHRNIYVKYTLKNGRELVRNFPVAFDLEAHLDPTSDLWAAQNVLNLREGIEDRSNLHDSGIELTPRNLAYVRLYRYASANRDEVSLYLPTDQAYAFVTDCLLPDIADGTMGREWLAFLSEERFDLDTVWNVEVYLEEQQTEDSAWGLHCRYELQMDAARCLAWIRANTDLDIQPLRVTDPPERDPAGRASGADMPITAYFKAPPTA